MKTYTQLDIFGGSSVTIILQNEKDIKEFIDDHCEFANDENDLLTIIGKTYQKSDDKPCYEVIAVEYSDNNLYLILKNFDDPVDVLFINYKKCKNYIQ